MLVLNAYYQALMRLFAIVRDLIVAPRHGSEGARRAMSEPPARSTARFDTAVGRYVYLTIDGVEHRVYFEEAGAGIPLLLQHTAGADARQWRHLLEDADVQRHYRMIAYDLPYHAKSVPPTGVEWWKQEYKLTRDFFEKVPVMLAKTLELDRPVFMGCSIGGHLAADLACDYPGVFRAAIALEGALASPARRDLSYLHHPHVSNEFKAAIMYGITAPSSPEAYRRETGWVYSQGAPPVFKGDLHYYTVEHDLTERAATIDTTKTALYVLTGEYDWSSTPAMGRALASKVPGATFREMRDVGHFPMCENPARFREYILPVLDEIRERG
jgi:pimeloyl-ACP methyl ester carboxylesterase